MKLTGIGTDLSDESAKEMWEAEKARRSIYKALGSHQDSQGVFADLILFACTEKDPSVRCGRLDMIAYIQDMLIGRGEA